MRVALVPRRYRVGGAALLLTLSPGGCAPPPVENEAAIAAEPALAPPSLDLERVAERVRHGFRRVGGVFAGGGRSHSVRAHDDGSFDVAPATAGGAADRACTFSTSSLRRGVRRFDVTARAASVDAEGGLHTERGEVVERLTNRDAGVEQSWRFARAPGGTGDLELRVAFSGCAWRSGGVEGHTFEAPTFGVVLRYGAATWIDAAGARAAIPMLRSGEELVATIPEALLARTAWPAVLDPLIGPEIALDAPVYGPARGEQRAAAMATDGAGGALVAWIDEKPGKNPDVRATRIDASGAPLDPGGIAISTAPGNQASVAVAFDGASYWIAWTTSGNVRAARVSAAGVLLDGPTSQDGVAVSTAGGSQTFPSVACSPQNCLVAWSDERNGVGIGDIYAARLDLAGNLLDGPADSGGIPVAAATGRQRDVDVTFDGTNYLLVWSDERVSGGGDGDLYGARLSPAGVLLDGPPDAGGKVLAGPANEQRRPRISAGAPSGGQARFLVVWEDKRTNLRDVYGLFVDDTLSVVAPGEFAIAQLAGIQEMPRLAFDGLHHLVVWEDQRTVPEAVYGVRVAEGGVLVDGNAASGGVLLASNVDPQTEPVVGAAATGTGWHIAWTDLAANADERDVLGRRVMNDAAPTSGPLQTLSLSANVEQTPTAAFGGSSYLVVWEDDRAGEVDLWGARVDADGTPLDPSGILVSGAPGEQRAPSVVYDGTGWLVVWQDSRSGTDSDVYGARVSLAGEVLTNPPSDELDLAISTAPFDQTAPFVIAGPGASLVVWQDARGGAGTDDVYGARVDPSGALVPTGPGVDFVVGSAPGVQGGPSGALLGGNWVVVWEDARDPSTVVDIYATRVDMATGEVAPGVAGFAVSTAPAKQLAPSVACRGASGCLVAWEDQRVSSVNSGIYGARLDAMGAVLDPAGLLLNDDATRQFRPVVSDAHDGLSYVVAWQDLKGAGGDVYGTWVTSSGAVLDPVSLPLAAALDPEFRPTLAADGAGRLLLAYQRHDDSSVFGADRIRARLLEAGLPLGSSCSTDDGCASRSCADGFCCETPCDEPCWTCAAQPGVCAPVAGEDDAECLALGSNTCDVSGACLPVLGQPCQTHAQCASGSCADGVCCDQGCAGPCDVCAKAIGAVADGVCTDLPKGASGAPSCAPYVCSGAAGACLTTCASEGDCAAEVPGYYCDQGTCQAESALGVACATDAQCQSKHCVDGVCCDKECAGQCEACAESSGAGTCVPVVGTPRQPRPACAGDGTACGGACDGVNRLVCTYPTGGCGVSCAESELTEGTCAQGQCVTVTKPCPGHLTCQDQASCKTQCAATSDCENGFLCSDGACKPASATCDGDHTLVGANPKDCTPYRCESVACKTSCATIDDCAVPNVCDAAGRCVAPAPSAGSEGGCGCVVPGRTGAKGAWAGVAATLLALFGPRRRARASRRPAPLRASR